MALPLAKLNTLVARMAEIDDRLSRPIDGETLVKLSRERAEIEPLNTAAAELRAAEAERQGLEALLADPEMAALADDERKKLDKRIAELTEKIRLLLLPKDAADEKSAILEIRAGTGGDEASLFAGALFRMYERYAAKQGWKVDIVSASEGAVGGYKEIIADITGRGVFAKLKYESGVHRVQRVPDTEASGRIHTSAATVAVLPQAEDVDVVIKDDDLKIDTMRAQGAGGQHVNKTESAIRVTHLPSGIVVYVQEDRSQHKNKAKAMALLRTKLYDAERARLDSARAADRKGQIGSGIGGQRL